MPETSRSPSSWFLAAAVAGLIGWLIDGPLGALLLGGIVVLGAVLVLATPAASKRYRAIDLVDSPRGETTAPEESGRPPSVANGQTKRSRHANDTEPQPAHARRPDNR
jgi:hypothetical protein